MSQEEVFFPRRPDAVSSPRMEALTHWFQIFMEQEYRVNTYVDHIVRGDVRHWKHPNDYTEAERRQFEYEKFRIPDYVRNTITAVVLGRKVTNPLGCEDNVYYYIGYHHGWGRAWAEYARLSGFRNRGEIGTCIHASTLFDMDNLKQMGVACLVLGIWSREQENEARGREQRIRELRKNRERLRKLGYLTELPQMRIEDQWTPQVPNGEPEFFLMYGGTAKEFIDDHLEGVWIMPPWGDKSYAFPRDRFISEDPLRHLKPG